MKFLRTKKRRLAVLAAGIFALAATGCSAGNSAAVSAPHPAPAQQSDILNSVLTKEIYTELMSSYTGNGNNPLYYSFPYGFFRTIGIDSEQYRNGDKQCFCSAYIQKGERTLKFSLRAERDNGKSHPYYICYTVSYQLSDREYGEYELLHGGNYIEAPFFVQELAEQKPARILSQAKITAEAYNAIYEELYENRTKYSAAFDGSNPEIDFLGVTETGVSVTMRSSCTGKITEGKLLTVNAEAARPPQTEPNNTGAPLVLSVSKPLRTQNVSDEQECAEITSYPCSFRRFEKTIVS